MLKILIQGELGSFHHEAAVKLFGENIEVVPCASFAELYVKLAENSGAKSPKKSTQDSGDKTQKSRGNSPDSDDLIALSAIENSLHGPINEVYARLENLATTGQIQIFAETELAIQQNLIAFKNATSGDIREIYSHPVALNQCENYLAQHFPDAEKIEYEDTAAAVRFIAEQNDPTKAAIAGAQAAELYRDRVKILARAIEDNQINFTRFVALAPPEKVAHFREMLKIVPDLASVSGGETDANRENNFAKNTNSVTLSGEPKPRTRSEGSESKNLEGLTPENLIKKSGDKQNYKSGASHKTSIVLITSHKSGALAEALNLFAQMQINLLNLVSRPVIGEKWRYKFYIDFAADAAKSGDIIAKLRENGHQVIFLGNYLVL